MNYYGIILNKSLTSENFLSNYSVKATKRFAASDWHVHLIVLSEKALNPFITNLQEHMIDGPWYNHIFPHSRDVNNKNLYVVFKNKRYEADAGNILDMHMIKEYCEKLEIPDEQIVFIHEH